MDEIPEEEYVWEAEPYYEEDDYENLMQDWIDAEPDWLEEHSPMD